ncbi:DsbA family oxidoreductase [Aestuariimicrobium ganziense]|uniref:DsbA family oxidoreductase n=1 Tax=Aestuariimicrobium ganziense TaxID=2773677 RepID=UPI0019442604|nr:DsbA family oxidoreductase [Aestuariimicrobium ganziense]
MRIDIWSDVACPWCWIGKRRFEAALTDFEHADQVEVAWHSYQLDPTLPERHDGSELDYLVTRKGASAEQITAMFAHVTEQGRTVGAEFDFDKVVVANSATAHRLLQLAKREGKGDDLYERLFAAHFRDGDDIGDHDTLVGHAEAVGIDADAARDALSSDDLAQAVADDIATARQIGVQGVPFFVLDERYGVSGAQPTEVFGQVLDEVWRELHPAPTLLRPVAVDGVDVGQAGETCGPDGC